MSPETKPVKLKVDPLKSTASLRTAAATEFYLKSITHQFPWQSMPPTGLLIDLECSATVLEILIKLSFLWVLLVETGRPRTAGALDGERLATSDLVLATHAESATTRVWFQIDCKLPH